MPGHPQAEFRQHHTVNVGALVPGAAFLAAAVLRHLIPVHSSSKLRVRFKATAAGTLNLLVPLPGLVAGAFNAFGDVLATMPVALDKPAPVAVVADTEVIIEMGDAGGFELAGEAFVLLEFTAGVGAGAITQVSISQS